jgi:FixJ family two-component response regulator
MIEAEGHMVVTYPSAKAFLADPDRGRSRCLVVDLRMPGMDGIDLQRRLRAEKADVPIIFITGGSDLPTAVQAMREGAADLLQKPVGGADLFASIARALEGSTQSTSQRAARKETDAHLATLTPREREVMDRMLLGQANKLIAADLSISERTAEHHRQNVLRKMSVKNLAMLVRMVRPEFPGRAEGRS